MDDAATAEAAAAEILVRAPGARELESGTYGQGAEVLRHSASVWEALELRARVELDDEVDETELVVRGRRRVLALDLRAPRLRIIAAVPQAVDRWRTQPPGGRVDLEMLADGQAEHARLGWQDEPQAQHVMREARDVAHHHELPPLRQKGPRMRRRLLQRHLASCNTSASRSRLERLGGGCGLRERVRELHLRVAPLHLHIENEVPLERGRRQGRRKHA
mmetsp:Transcript_1500/g.3347  ORF Transcript_1500/g.3347 Transcript_1500/m.3347 type:complete len:219 (-) Transcript_1500:34-690(-)